MHHTDAQIYMLVCRPLSQMPLSPTLITYIQMHTHMHTTRSKDISKKSVKKERVLLAIFHSKQLGVLILQLVICQTCQNNLKLLLHIHSKTQHQNRILNCAPILYKMNWNPSCHNNLNSCIYVLYTHTNSYIHSFQKLGKKKLCAKLWTYLSHTSYTHCKKVAFFMCYLHFQWCDYFVFVHLPLFSSVVSPQFTMHADCTFIITGMLS